MVEPAPEAADLLKRAGDALGIAGELHRRRVGQILPLAADRGLDEIAEEGAGIADDQKAEPQRQHRARRRRRGCAGRCAGRRP
jgi:hypothetical protein